MPPVIALIQEALQYVSKLNVDLVSTRSVLHGLYDDFLS